MAELEYYESRVYREFLLSSKRREICPPDVIFSEFPINDVQNLLDFGAGNGFFLPEFRKRLPPTSWVWGAECQQDLIDELLQLKLKEEISNFTPFFVERSDHPLLPEWIVKPDAGFCALSISTFPDPGLALDGLLQSMQKDARLIIIDWAKVEYDQGPKLAEKVSLDKLKFLAEEYNIDIVKTVSISEYIYGVEARAGKDFEYGHYSLKEEEDD